MLTRLISLLSLLIAVTLIDPDAFEDRSALAATLAASVRKVLRP